MSEHFHETVARIYLSGKQPAEIAKMFGVDSRNVYNALARARSRGMLSPTGRKPRTDIVRFNLYSRSKKLGSIREVFTLLTPAQQDWLYDQVPAGSTVAGVLAMIVRDAYDEEKGGE